MGFKHNFAKCSIYYHFEICVKYIIVYIVSFVKSLTWDYGLCRNFVSEEKWQLLFLIKNSFMYNISSMKVWGVITIWAMRHLVLTCKHCPILKAEVWAKSMGPDNSSDPATTRVKQEVQNSAVKIRRFMSVETMLENSTI